MSNNVKINYRFTLKKDCNGKYVTNGLKDTLSEDEFIVYIKNHILLFINSSISFDKLGKFIKNENKYNITFSLNNDKTRISGMRNVNSFIRKKIGGLQKLYDMVIND